MSLGASLAAASVTRRWATAPSASARGERGASSGHQVTTGTSGTSSGAATESACWPSGPYMRSKIISPGPVSPTRISASSRDSALGLRVMTAIIRLGCSRPAWLAARTASYCAASLQALLGLQTPPCPPVPCHQRVGGRGARRTRRILVRLGVRGPEFFHRVEDPPAELDFGLPGEQRRVADEDVEQQPLVGLGAGFGEGLAVGEVHVHVPDLHGRARHLRAEPDRDAL